MSGAGRLTGTIGLRTQRLIYGEPDGVWPPLELSLITQVDLAHLVMLAQCELIERRAAARLVSVIEELRRTGFAALRDVPQPRGLYLAYEQYLMRELGDDVGGTLHTGRSRNDLKATTTALRLRSWLADFLADATRLAVILLCRARAHRDTVMPVYTHFQAAMPITYGYYLLGVACALDRDLTAIRQAAAGLARCPLGASAVAGNDLPIDPARTAALLGFAAPALHAVDAVASRDTMLRVLAAVAGLGVTLSRLATDLQLWSTTEFGFVVFPERLVGGSSAMPQKRNAFLLEHVKAKAGAAVGAWSAAAGMMKSTPFTNTIEVSTESVAAMWPGLTTVHDSVLLAQVLVSGARPVPDRMARRAEEGFVTATSVADELVRQGVPFRTAHTVVGAAVRRAVDDGTTVLPPVAAPGGPVTAPALPAAVAALDHGGGPGEFSSIFAAVCGSVLEHRAWSADWRASSSDADRGLADAVSAMTAGLPV